MALLSWAEKMDPPLPLLVNPSLRASTTNGDCFEQARARKEAMDNSSNEAIPAHPGKFNFSSRLHLDTEREDNVVITVEPSKTDAEKPMTDFTLINAPGFAPFVLHDPHGPVPIVMANRAPHGSMCLARQSVLPHYV